MLVFPIGLRQPSSDNRLHHLEDTALGCFIHDTLRGDGPWAPYDHHSDATAWVFEQDGVRQIEQGSEGLVRVPALDMPSFRFVLAAEAMLFAAATIESTSVYPWHRNIEIVGRHIAVSEPEFLGVFIHWTEGKRGLALLDHSGVRPLSGPTDPAWGM